MPYFDEDALTELVTAKEWMRVEGAASDAVIASMIVRVSRILLQLSAHRYIAVRNYKDVFHGRNDRYRTLGVPNVVSVTSVTIDGEVIPQAASYTDKGYLFDDKQVFVQSYTFGAGFRNVEVLYRAGVDADSYLAAIFEQACLETLNFKWERREHPDKLAQEVGKQITSRYSEKDLPPEVISSISKIARVIPFYGVTTIVTP